jgi:hypothetical protein
MELHKGELFFIKAIREFDFLRKLRYEGSKFSIVGREFYIEFENHKTARTVAVILRESQEIDVLICRKRFLGIEQKNIEEFNRYKECPKTLESYAQLLKENFEDILEGKNW